MTTSMFLTPDKQAFIPIIYQTKDGKEITLTIDDIKRFLIRGNPEYATVQELVFFAGVCRARGMDPYAGDCYLIKYSKKDAAAIVTARSYFESRAKAQKDCKGWKAGIVVVNDEKEIYRDGALTRQGDLLIGGWFEGHSDKWDFPLTLEVSLQMYIKKTSEGHVTKFWSAEKQAHMIRKVALVQGLRELWPNEFASLYSPEEMGPETPEPAAITLGDSEVTDIPAAHEDLKADLEKKKEEIDKQKAEAAEAAAQEKAQAEAKDKEEDKEVIRRRALVKTFDAKTDAAKLSSQDVNDYLFKTLEKLGDDTTIEDLKVKAVEQGLVVGLVEDMVKVSKKEEETEPPPAVLTAATLGTDAEEIIKHFKMRKKEGILEDLSMYEAEKHLWPLDAQVAYAQKIKDITKAHPDIMETAMNEIYPPVSSEDAAAGPETQPCGKCGVTSLSELCDKCAADEAGESGEDPERKMFYAYLEKCAEVKKQLIAKFGKEKGEAQYYGVFGSHGFEKSNQVAESRETQRRIVTELYDLLK